MSVRWVSRSLAVAALVAACSDRNTGKIAPPRDAGASDVTFDATSPIEAATPPVEIAFRKIVLTTAFFAEGANFGDFDGDGVNDVVSGPYWYEGPSFTAKHEMYAPVPFDPHGYSDSFFDFVRDFDHDGHPDVLAVDFPGRGAAVFQNPGQPDASWTRHDVVGVVDMESPAFTDLTGDGNDELVFSDGERIGWASPLAGAPFEPWVFHGASSSGNYPAFTHGLGIGDVDGDGRSDVIEATGYWSQPANLAGAPAWSKHAQAFGSGGAQMFAYDVDGDGDSDVITSLAAHEYGISWFEQRTEAGATTFVEHVIATADPADAGSSPLVFQPHALALADIDGNGLADIVTGERFWGHVPAGDPDPAEPAKLYWFELRRDAGGAHFVPHLIDSASGVGTQVVAADVNGDGLVDVVTASKKGAFVFLQAAR